MAGVGDAVASTLTLGAINAALPTTPLVAGGTAAVIAEAAQVVCTTQNASTIVFE